MKYLKLGFSGAKLFHNTPKTKDIITDYTVEGGRRNREESFCFKEPLTVYQISNVIHTLFGERPVPSMKTVFFEKDSYLFNKARESHLKLTIFKKFNKNKNEHEFLKEKTRLKKAVWNSWNPGTYINWSIIKKYVGDVYDEFINIASKELGYRVDERPFNEVQEDFLILFKKPNEVKIFLEKNKMTTFMGYLAGKYTSSSVTSNEARSAITNVSGIEDVVVLSGEILIPVTDDDIERIKSFRGACTILDGGMVSIEGIIDANDISEETIKEYQLVGEISEEKIYYQKQITNEA